VQKDKQLRVEIVPVRLTAREKARAVKLADKLGIAVSAVFRQGMNRFYDEVFRDRADKADAR